MIFSIEDAGSIFGSTPGGGWNFVEVRPDSKEVVVRMQAVYPQVRNNKVMIYQADAMQATLGILRSSILEVLVSILDLTIGVALIIYYLITRKELSVGRGLWYFGLFSVMMGIWSLNETKMMTILVENRGAASYIGYMMIMLMIAPFALYVKETLEMEDDKVGDIICIISFVNAIACVVLHMTRMREFKQSVMGTHLLMLVDLVYLLYALIQRMRKKEMDRAVRVNLVGLFILVISYVVDIIAYYIGATKTDVVGRFGFLLYIILLGREAANNTVARVKAGRKAEIYKELAEKDMLTGLYNRNAYDEWVSKNLRQPGMGIITFDLNELKKCNDTYGHALGDQYIQDAAALLANVFEPEARCYRIGGDEFCAVIGDAQETWIDEQIRNLQELERQYNQKIGYVQMHIAHGYAIFDEKLDGDIEDTRSRADLKMYENKRAIKTMR